MTFADELMCSGRVSLCVGIVVCRANCQYHGNVGGPSGVGGFHRVEGFREYESMQPFLCLTPCLQPFLRRMLTRLLGLIPSMIVAVAVGRDGLNTLLVASQVVLSIVLPFVAFPLIYLTSSKSVMRVHKPPTIKAEEPEPVTIVTEVEVCDHMALGIALDVCCETPDRIFVSEKQEQGGIEEEKREVVTESLAVEEEVISSVSSTDDAEEFVDYSNGWLTICVVSVIFVVVLAANVYVIVTLALGNI